MIESFNGKSPRIAGTAFVHPSAHIRGDVEIGEYSIIWPGASIAGDDGLIRIGNCVMIEDNAVIHGGSYDHWKEGRKSLLEIGDFVTIGHSAVVHSNRIGSRVLIGMNSTVLSHTEIGDYCVVAAGTVVPEGTVVPDRSLAAGNPAKVIPLAQKHVDMFSGNEDNLSFYMEYIRKWREGI